MGQRNKAEKLADKRIERIYYRSCSGVQISVMDIGKVFAVGHKAISEGGTDDDIERAIVTYVQTIRKN
jgi:hypothetical protein